MMKKFAAALLLFSLAALLSSCLQPAAPAVKFLSANLGRVTTDGLEVNFNFEVANSNPIPLNVNNYWYKIYINERELASASREGFSLAAAAKTNIAIPAFVRYDQLFGTVNDLIERQAKGLSTFDYRIDGAVNGGALGLTFGSPIKAAGTINIPKEIQ